MTYPCLSNGFRLAVTAVNVDQWARVESLCPCVPGRTWLDTQILTSLPPHRSPIYSTTDKSWWKTTPVKRYCSPRGETPINWRDSWCDRPQGWISMSSSGDQWQTASRLKLRMSSDGRSLTWLIWIWCVCVLVCCNCRVWLYNRRYRHIIYHQFMAHWAVGNRESYVWWWERESEFGWSCYSRNL